MCVCTCSLCVCSLLSHLKRREPICGNATMKIMISAVPFTCAFGHRAGNNYMYSCFLILRCRLRLPVALLLIAAADATTTTTTAAAEVVEVVVAVAL